MRPRHPMDSYEFLPGHTVPGHRHAVLMEEAARRLAALARAGTLPPLPGNDPVSIDPPPPDLDPVALADLDVPPAGDDAGPARCVCGCLLTWRASWGEHRRGVVHQRRMAIILRHASERELDQAWRRFEKENGA